MANKGQLTLRRKVLRWFFGMVAVIVLAFWVDSGISRTAAGRFDLLLNDNLLCYQTHKAIDAEQQAFETYARAPSEDNRAVYEQACAETWRCINALPFDYTEIGRERYARTWNLKNGYEGYQTYRDALLLSDPGETDYVERLYQVFEMQEALSSYALRLAYATLEYSEQLYRQSTSFFWLMPVLFAVLLAAVVGSAVFFLRLISRSVLKPLLRMTDAAARIAANDFSGPDLPAEGPEEVARLTREFNRMRTAAAENQLNREALHQQQLDRLELEKELHHTQLEMLKSQVNPHFLFNTLHLISCMARLEGASVIDQMILALSNLFRYNLRTTAQQVPLAQELEALEDYLYIQQMRFDGRIVCKKQLELDPQAVQLPSFTLQPLVENCFVHGLAHREEGGQITLRAWMQGETLMLSVADNGEGMTGQKLEAVRRQLRQGQHSGRGIGLGNIAKRLEMLYAGSSLQIYSRPGHGTAVQLQIPQPVSEEGKEKRYV